jgi:hypothetical protein
MSEHFIELAYNLSQAGMVPGLDFSYDPAGKQLLLSDRSWDWIESVAPGARDRARKRFS